MYTMFLQIMLASFSLLIVALTPFRLGSNNGMSRKRYIRNSNRALEIKHQFELEDDELATAAEQWAMLAPADGIVNRVEVEARFNQDISNTPKIGGVYFNKTKKFGDYGFVGPMWTGGGASSFITMEGTHIVPIPFAGVNSGDAVIVKNSRDTIIRMRAADRLFFKAYMGMTGNLGIDCDITLTVHFSIQGQLGRFQETVPFAINFASTDDQFNWMPPCPGMMYGLQIIVWDNDTDYSMKLAFGQKDAAKIGFDMWSEVKRETRTYDINIIADAISVLFVKELYVAEKHGFRVSKYDQDADPGSSDVLIVGYFAPKPGSNFNYNIQGNSSSLELTMPFPAYLKELDISTVWGTPTLGDEMMAIRHYPFEADLDYTEGSSFLYESSDLIFILYSNAASSSDRWQENIDISVGFDDLILIEVDANMTKFAIIISGKIPAHRYSIRPVATWLEGTQIVETSEVL